MDRKQKLLNGIDIRSSVGVEIGALCRPFVTRDDGNIIYVDHADTTTLKNKYYNDPDVAIDEIVDIDAVWGENTLAEAVGIQVDYVVASHVIEHVPDLITWLAELRSILKPSGEVRLIVPDKRFTFDYLRHETRLADVLYAKVVNARVPLPHIVLDYVLNVVKLDGGKAWRGELDESALERHHTLQHALAVAQQAKDGIYHDVHCWIFTPRSFALLFAELAEQGLLNFECTNFYDTEPYTIEFFVGLRPTDDLAKAANSWRAMARSTLTSSTLEKPTVIPSTDREPLPLKTKMRRACLFSFYDEQGIVDDYVIFFLKELGKFVEKILFYSNSPLSRDAEIALRGFVSEVILRPNVGFDVLAYKEGLQKIEFNREDLYDEVLMVNHTCYGPVFPFEELFSSMSQRQCDFWGITAHMEMTPNPFTGTGTLPYHLNSNFIVIRKDLLRSQAFRNYWIAIGESATYEAAVQSHEVLFTEYFTRLGYTCECYLDCAKYGTLYPAIYDIDETVVDRNPILKRRAFFNDPRVLEHNAVDLPRALRIIEETSDYDRSMIWKNIVRSAELRTLNTNAALTSVLPDVRLRQGEYPQGRERVAVCTHVYYTDMLDEILALTDTIPCSYDFIATTETAEKKQEIENKVRGRKNIANVIVRVVEHNRGRDMSSLFITCRDLFLNDHYDLVCRLHTKKSPQVAAGRANGFKRHMFENLLNSPGYTANVLDMFHDNPWIGVAVPPLVHIGYPTMGHTWFANRPRANEVAKMLGLKVTMDPNTPVGAFGTMFWFRPKALRTLFAYPWKWSDFNAEPHHVDGGLAHVLERLICYVAQDARYTTQQIISSRLAGRNYAMLEYKLQRLSASLPNGDFNYDVHILDEWKRAEYRDRPEGSPNPEPVAAGSQQLTIKQAWREVVLAMKRSLAHRSPSATNLLRPVYRAIVGKK